MTTPQDFGKGVLWEKLHWYLYLLGPVLDRWLVLIQQGVLEAQLCSHIGISGSARCTHLVCGLGLVGDAGGGASSAEDLLAASADCSGVAA